MKQQAFKFISNNIGTAMDVFTLLQVFKDKILPEYKESKQQDFQIENPNIYSCIYEGSETQETLKRKSFILRQQCLEDIEQFIAQYDFNIVLDIYKIAENFYDQDLQCCIINLAQVSQYKLEGIEQKSKQELLNVVIDELQVLLFEYYKGKFIQQQILSEFIVHHQEIKEVIYKHIQRQAKKSQKSVMNQLTEQVKQLTKQQNENIHLQQLCIYIQNSNSIEQCKNLINNFFKNNQEFIVDTIQSLYGFKLSEVILTKYYETINKTFCSSIKNSLDKFYYFDDQSYEILYTTLAKYYIEYITNPSYMNNYGIWDTNVNDSLKFIIYSIQWEDKLALSVRKLLQYLSQFSKQINESRINLWDNALQVAEQLNQYKKDHCLHCQQAQLWYQQNIQAAQNVVIIFQLYLHLAGITMNQQKQLIFEQYKPMNRIILMKIVRCLNNGQSNYINMIIIKILEQLTAQIQQQLLIQIRDSKQYDQLIISLLDQEVMCGVEQNFYQRNQFLIQFTNSQKYFKQSKSTSIQLIHSQLKGQQQGQLEGIQAIQKEYLYRKMDEIQIQFLPTLDPPQYLFFELISKPEYPSTVITLCISGFISEDEDKYDQWKGMIQRGGSTVIALHWKCSTLKEFGTFLLKKIATSAITTAAFSSISALMAALTIYTDNPFSDAEKEAQRVGRYLGYLIGHCKIFGDCQINIVCHSLGTLMLHECIKELDSLYEKNKIQFINSIMMMGGVADIRKLQKRRWHCVGGQIYNVYSKKDSVLSYLLQVIKVFNRPCGKQRVYLGYREVQNYDFTQFIDGHAYYKQQMQRILQQTDFDNDFKYLFNQEI